MAVFRRPHLTITTLSASHGERGDDQCGNDPDRDECAVPHLLRALHQLAVLTLGL